MKANDTAIDRVASQAARAFGSLVRSRRRALAMNQAQLALAIGVGRRFLIDLEAGKATCQLGRSLVVADALGLRPPEIGNTPIPAQPASAADLPDLPDEEVAHA